MGFRNPVRDAETLDTRAGLADPGVSIEGASATWYDGAGSAGRVELRTPPGGGTGFSGFSVVGADQHALAAARLDLLEEELPAGGYHSVAAVTADEIRLNGQPTARRRMWQNPRGGDPSNSFAAGAYVVMISQDIAGAPAGDYSIVAELVLSCTVTSAAFMMITANGATLTESRIELTTLADRKPMTVGLEDFAGGALSIRSLIYATSGTATITSGGSAHTTSYLGPRS